MEDVPSTWYQIHVKTTNNSLSGNFNPEAQGPFDAQTMLARVKEILQAKRDPSGQVPHYALVTLVEAGACRSYEKRREGWTLVSELDRLTKLPSNTRRLPIVATAQRGKLLLTDFGFGDLAIREFVEDGSDKDSPKFLENFPYNRALVVEATLTPYREVGVDLDVVRSSLQAEPYPDTFPEGYGHLRSPRAELGDVPIAGFRSWRLNIPSQIVGQEIIDSEPSLYGPHYWLESLAMYRWEDAQKSAQCNRNDHLSPDPDCACGIYALHDQATAARYIASGPEMSLSTMVCGAILGSGNVLVHKDGWRSEYARIIGFDGEHVEARFRPALQRLAAKFEVPILSSERLAQLAMKKGRLIRKSDLEEPDLG